MNVLVIGSGGREHALAWRLAQSPSVMRVVVAPGNPGIARESRIECTGESLSLQQIVEFAPDLVVIGPEQPLVDGLPDELRRAGIDVVGPSAAAARLEGSKAFTKALLEENGIPSAEYRVCRTPDEARRAVRDFGVPVVIKADGLAAGKGVSVCESEAQAHAAIETIMNERLFGDAGDVVVVERFLSGFEASVIVMMDEKSHVVLPPAQDHKQIGEGGVGANTGGMGAIAPNPEITPLLEERIAREIVEPSVQALQRAGWIFRGFLFIGLMIDHDGPRVLEYNVRFGDPEAQAILPLVEGDFGLLLRGLARGALATAVDAAGYGVRDGATCTVVASAGGYPGPYQSGQRIELTSPPANGALHDASQVFFAGVARCGNTDVERPGVELCTAGGRVLSVTAAGDTLDQARRRAYARLQLVTFDGMYYRQDIGGAPILPSVIEEADLLMLQFRKRGGLVPVVVQDVSTNEVLMLAYANQVAVAETRRSGYATFWSTSRGELWIKGQGSGDRLRVEEVRVDCDQDALLYRVHLEGHGVCHTHTEDGRPRYRCFYRSVNGDGSLTNDNP